MDPAIVAFVAAVFLFRLFSTKSPSRLTLAKPTTVWPVARVGPGLALAGAMFFLLPRLGFGGGVIVAVVVFVFLIIVKVEKSTTVPLRIVYERGARSILQWQLIAVVAALCLVWAFAARLS